MTVPFRWRTLPLSATGHRRSGRLLRSCAGLLILAAPLTAEADDELRADASARGARLVPVMLQDGAPVTLYTNSAALVVGWGAYQGGFAPLPQATEDAGVVADALRDNGFTVVCASNLTRRAFLDLFHAFGARYGEDPRARILVYLAGHGVTETLQNGTRSGSLAMVDAPEPESDPVGYALASVSMDRLYEETKRLRAHHVLVMFDACFSGALLAGRAGDTVPAGIRQHILRPVRQFITAGSADQPVPAESAFRRIFVDLLRGRRPDYDRDGYLTGRELAYLLARYVPEETHGRQSPQHAVMNQAPFNEGDFVFVLPAGTSPPHP